MRLGAGWVVLRSERPAGFELAASFGMPEGAAVAQAQCAWERRICAEVLELGKPKMLAVGDQDCCPAADCLQTAGLVLRACIPLKSKEHILGVMSLVGSASEDGPGLAGDTVEVLTAIGRQIGIAVENARLYEELRQKEVLRRQLLESVITAQEEERERVALELHDQTGQPLTSLIMTLEVLEQAGSREEMLAHVHDLQSIATQMLEQVHDLALELRPRLLDDLGLPAAIRHYLREYQDRFHLTVDSQVLGLDGHRLPPKVETALYRIVQEALTNVVRHAQAQSVSVLLESRGTSVVLVIEDDGKGFDVAQVMSSRVDKRSLGLYGMEERASLVGGQMTIESTPGMGTTVLVEIPLRQGGNHEQDSPAGG